jgi:hypothetical protein
MAAIGSHRATTRLRGVGGEQRGCLARAVVLHCRALLSKDETEAERLFLAAFDAHAEAARPFDHARSEIAYGEYLRRVRPARRSPASISTLSTSAHPRVASLASPPART